MTESDWLACTTRPADMLRQVARTAAARKLQLVGCACCRLVWEHIPEVGAAAVADLERCYDGPAAGVPSTEARSELVRAFTRSGETGVDSVGYAGLAAAYAVAAYAVVLSLPAGGLGACLQYTQAAAARAAPARQKDAAARRVRRQICNLFREVIGNPFRPWTAVPDFLGGGVVQPDGRTVRLTETVRHLARGIQAEQAFDRLPILADALEEAGFTDPELLDHCRRPGGHVRGCWALDVALGRT
jgi:hypothetical protein